MARALQQAVDARTQIDNGATRFQMRAAFCVQYGTATCCQDDILLRRQVTNDFCFTLAKTRLAFDFKNQRNGCAGTGFDFMIGIDEPLIQSFRQSPTDRRFAGPHQADQKNIPAHCKFFPYQVQQPTWRCLPRHPT
jgi:hypothetical protein